jgi:Ras-related protein Rab-1A
MNTCKLWQKLWAKNQDEDEDNDYRKLKIVTVGDSGVGKSSLISCFASTSTSTSTTQVPHNECVFTKKMYDVLNEKISLDLWETSDEELSRVMTYKSCAGAHGLVVVFDITRLATFKRIDEWLPHILRYAQERANVILVGNKSDAVLDRQVGYETAKSYADTLGTPYIETSTTSSVNDAYLLLTENIIQKMKNTPIRRAAASGYMYPRGQIK